MFSVHYDTIDSTSTRAIELAKLNPGERLLVSAFVQTHGRGRSGRMWVSPRGGAWFSILWPIMDDPAVMRPAPLVAGLAVRQVIIDKLALTGVKGADERVRIKWPNDILVDGRKIAGILCEQVVRRDYTYPDGTPAAELCIGVGINVNLQIEQLTHPMRTAPTSLLIQTERYHALRPIIQTAGKLIEQSLMALARHGLTEHDVNSINAVLAWRDQPVQLEAGMVTVQGVLLGVDQHGHLQLDVDGQTKTYNAGEVRRLTRANQPAERHDSISVIDR